MAEKLVNFRMDEDKYQELKMLALKERTQVKSLVSGLIEEYIVAHKDGNPQFKLDQFEDPDFIACPAVFRDSRTWKNYCTKATPQEKENLKNQIIMIDKNLSQQL